MREFLGGRQEKSVFSDLESLICPLSKSMYFRPSWTPNIRLNAASAFSDHAWCNLKIGDMLVMLHPSAQDLIALEEANQQKLLAAEQQQQQQLLAAQQLAAQQV